MSIANFMYVFGEYMVVTVGLKVNDYIAFDVSFDESNMWEESAQEEWEEAINKHKQDELD